MQRETNPPPGFKSALGVALGFVLAVIVARVVNGLVGGNLGELPGGVLLVGVWLGSAAGWEYVVVGRRGTNSPSKSNGRGAAKAGVLLLGVLVSFFASIMVSRISSLVDPSAPTMLLLVIWLAVWVGMVAAWRQFVVMSMWPTRGTSDREDGTKPPSRR